MQGGVGTAYTVYNPNAAFVLRIPPKYADSAAVATTSKRTAKTQQSSWLVSFNFQNTFGDGLNPIYFGYAPASAKTTYLQKPPSFGSIGVSVYDPQSNRYFGHAVVHDVSTGGATVQLAFQNGLGSVETIKSFVGKSMVLPSGLSVRFFDPARGKWTTQTDTINVSVPPHGTTIVFAGVGKDAFFAGLAPLLSQYKTQLTSVYPNPCVSKLMVKYTLPFPVLDVKEIYFAIYNLQGKIVWAKRFVDGFRPGENSIVFDRAAAPGGKLATGICILRMNVVNAVLSENRSFTRRISFVY
jgi:hypothetical protein